MSLVKFRSISSLFQKTGSDDASSELMEETLLLVLARAITADTNVDPNEIAVAQQVLLEVTGESVSIEDIKLAGQSALFEKQSLDRFLNKATRKLSDEDRIIILQGLIRVLRSDEHIREFELDYFDRVANALKATPSEIAGLRAGPAD